MHILLKLPEVVFLRSLFDPRPELGLFQGMLRGHHLDPSGSTRLPPTVCLRPIY